MVHTNRYIQWQKTNFSTEEARIADAIKHWQHRYELGTGLLLTEDPSTALKAVQKQWRKLTRQLQQERQHETQAEDILKTTRTISRMQRVKFTLQDPLENPNANFYILDAEQLTAIPTNCYTLYALSSVPQESVTSLLASDALVVAYRKDQPTKNLLDKSQLEHQLQAAESEILAWLKKYSIELSLLSVDLEKANEALDILLGSHKLQTEFLTKTKALLHILQLASPLKISDAQQERLKALEKLEKHVRVLSPAFLSDHILDSEADDAFLLRDLTKKGILTLEALREFVKQQYQLGHSHLASALEQKSGFVRL